MNINVNRTTTKEWGTAQIFFYLPVAADQFISMRLQQQRPQDILHAARHILLWYSSQPGIHTQGFSSCHVVQHCVKLRAVPDALLHLQTRDKCPLSNPGLLKAAQLSTLYIQHTEIPKFSHWNRLIFELNVLPLCSHLLNVPQDAVSVNIGVPRGNALVTCQHLKGCGLACSIEAQEAEALSFSYC